MTRSTLRWVAATRRAIVALAAMLSLASPAAADVYQWTDKDGVVYYTTDPERIPAEFRATARVTRSMPRDPDEPVGAHSIAVTAGAPILAEAHLNGVALTLVLDTGASRTIISPAALARAGFVTEGQRRARLIGVAGVTEAPEITVPRLDVAGAQLGPLRVLAYDVPGVSADGLLGRDVLDQFTLTIDPARGRATLTR